MGDFLKTRLMVTAWGSACTHGKEVDHVPPPRPLNP